MENPGFRYYRPPEYGILNKQVAIAEQEVKLNRSELLPRIGVRGSYDYLHGLEINDETFMKKGAFSVFLNVSVPLFHFGERTNKVKSAKAKLEQTRLEQENAELGTEEINDSVHQAQGIVMDATMNGFTMVTSKKDTLYISTMDRNIALEKGLLIGDTLEVSYTITEDEPGINIASAITKIH